MSKPKILLKHGEKRYLIFRGLSISSWYPGWNLLFLFGEVHFVICMLSQGQKKHLKINGYPKFKQ